MQEVVQYEASYGSRFPIVISVVAAIYIYTNISFATNGNRLGNLTPEAAIFMRCTVAYSARRQEDVRRYFLTVFRRFSAL